MSTTPLFLFLQMGSDHVSFPGVFVFQHEGFSPPPSLPPSLSLKELGLEALVLHPPPHSPPATGGRYQAALRSPSRPSRRPAAPQELRAHPQPGFTSRAGQARPGLATGKGKKAYVSLLTPPPIQGIRTRAPSLSPGCAWSSAPCPSPRRCQDSFWPVRGPGPPTPQGRAEAGSPARVHQSP